MTDDILVVEDNLAILEGIHQLLIQSGYSVKIATSGNAGVDLLFSNPQLVILDVNLPDIDGFTICSYIRQLPLYIPVMMLTARDEITDKVRGLEMGADEYITKPFEPRELLSRVRAMLRFAARTQTNPSSEQIERPLEFGTLRVWLNTHYAEIAGERLELTRLEWTLLQLFVQNPGQLFGRETLLHRVWGVDYFGDARTVDTHVKRLRAKLAVHPSTANLIQTVRGFGYRFTSQ